MIYLFDKKSNERNDKAPFSTVWNSSTYWITSTFSSFSFHPSTTQIVSKLDGKCVRPPISATNSDSKNGWGDKAQFQNRGHT